MATNGKIKSVCLFAVILFLVPVLIPGTSFSAVVFKSLNPITHGLKMPEDVAVSNDGKAYVVDGYQNKVLIYDKKGQPAGSISIEKPTSVAVNNGFIYIGTNKDLSVKILDSSLQIIGSLGIGAKEFKLPRNIAVDKATGNVYVVDQIDNSIKAYTPTGTFISKINDYPNQPQDVTIINNEIYVVDQPLITDSWGGTIRGGQVQVFGMTGAPIRKFGSYGTLEGQFIRPAGITSDSNGILYITDSFHGVVMCFDSGGSYLGAIQNPSKPMVTPMGIALGEDRRLFIASLYTASVHIFGLEGYTGTVDVSPSELSFTAQQGQSNPPEQALTISNSGTDTLTYTAAGNESWILVTGSPVTVVPNSSGAISVGVNISGLSAATYNGEITITANSGAMEVIPVTLEITAPPEIPVLTVTPQTLDYTYRIGDPAPSSQTVTIELSSNTGGTTTWTATSDSLWISISPSAMAGNGNSYTMASVNVNPADLTPGDYKGSITIDAPDATGSPATIGVNLTVKCGGTINVRCNIPGASFKITGSKDYEGSGETWSATEVSDGTYTITYNPVTGYKTPLSDTKTISSGGTISFEGSYTSLAMSADIVVSRGADLQNPPAIGIFNANGTMLASFTPFSGSKYTTSKDRKLYGVSGVNTAVGDIDGDGKADIVAGLAAGSSNPAEVAAYRADGTLIEGSDFIALSTMYGATLAAADFDGDGKAEIVAGAGAGSRNPATVRVFSYDSGTIIDTGVNFNAFTVKGGVNLAVGDIDGDGIPELITAAGANSYASPEVRVWKIDTSGGQGHWSILDTGIHIVAFSGRYGASVTTGDLNGDGISEIIAASGPDPQGGSNMIKAFNGDGTEFGLVITDSSVGYGLNVASADLDSDGLAEIVAGLGPSSKNPSTVKIYKADGTLLNTFNAFNHARYGAVVSAGDLGY